MSDKTHGKPSKEMIVFKQCKINDFDAMITETLEALDKVLNQREKDLKTWEDKEKNEFQTTFGIWGDEFVHINMPVRGEQHLVKISAKGVMEDCIRRIRYVKSTMTIKSFINKINEPREVSAKVPGEPQKDYKVEIGINFVGRRKKDSNEKKRICSKLTGHDSRVSTLCHELSHIPKFFTDPNGGGMGTSDYDSEGNKQSPYQEDNDDYNGHVKGANKLITENKFDLVFDNAYNIERYFEIEIKNE